MATSINNSNSAIATLSATMATSINNRTAAITSVNNRVTTLSATLATSINNSNSAITALSATMATSISNSNSAITSVNNRVTTLSATLATSIANRTAAITSVNTRINSVSVLAETKASAATSANLETRINSVSVLAETKASAATSANLETRINSVSVLAETKASAATSASLQTRINTLSATMATSINNRTLAITSVNTRINSVSILAETKASAATSANLQTRINTVSSTMATSIANVSSALGSRITTLSATMATSISNKVSKSGDTMTGDLLFGDDDRAIFGAGSDLRIYHDGFHSYIYDTGAGDLRIRGVNLQLQSDVGENYLSASNNGAVTLYHDNSAKLATTSTGIDVTGTVTAYGLSVVAPTGNLEALLESTAGTPSILFKSASGTVNTRIRSGVGGAANLQFETGGSERMRIDSSGNVGIGTTSPASALHIVNSDLATQLRISDTTADATTKYGTVLGSHFTNSEEPVAGMLLKSSSSSNGNTVSIGGGISSANAANQISFYTAANKTTLEGSERMRIDSAGRLSVGTTSSFNDGVISALGSGRQAITAKVTNNANLLFQGFNSSGTAVIQAVGTGDFYATGNVGIGLTSPTEKLHVSGNILATGNVTAFSDERLKDNIETLDGSKVYEMRGVSFTKDGEASSGVIAQEIQKVAPELVNDSGEYLSVAYGNLVGYLIEGMKQLKQEVVELKAEVEQLKSEK